MSARRKLEPLPALMTARQVQAESGLPAATCRTLMQHCELVRPPGVRRVFVRRDEIMRLVEESRP